MSPALSIESPAPRPRAALRGLLTGVLWWSLLVLVALWLVLYFLLNSSWARSQLVAQLPASATAVVHKVAPSLLVIRVGLGSVRDGGIALADGAATAEFGLFPPRVTLATARVREVVLAVVGPGTTTDSGPTDGGPPAILDALDLGLLPSGFTGQVEVDVLWIEAPDLLVRVEGLSLRHDRGTLATLQGTALGCALRAARPALSLNLVGCEVQLRVGDAPRRLEALATLDPGDGSFVQVSASLARQERGEIATAQADLLLTPRVQRELGFTIGQGDLVVQGLRLEARSMGDPAAPWEFGWEALGLGGLGSVREGASGIAAGAGRLTVEPAGILTRVELAVDAVELREAALYGFELEGLTVGELRLSMDKRVEGSLASLRLVELRQGGVVVEAILSDLLVAMGIAGGTVQGLLQTGDGLTSGALSVRRSPITAKTSVSARLLGSGLLGPLWPLLSEDLVGAATALPPDAVLTEALLALEVDPDDGELTVTRDEVRLTLDGKRWLWDGLDWVGLDDEP